jgi:hypothetical protein
MEQSSMQRSISNPSSATTPLRMICQQPKPSSNYLCNKPAAPSSQKSAGSTVFPKDRCQRYLRKRPLAAPWKGTASSRAVWLPNESGLEPLRVAFLNANRTCAAR